MSPSSLCCLMKKYLRMIRHVQTLASIYFPTNAIADWLSWCIVAACGKYTCEIRKFHRHSTCGQLSDTATSFASALDFLWPSACLYSPGRSADSTALRCSCCLMGPPHIGNRPVGGSRSSISWRWANRYKGDPVMYLASICIEMCMLTSL